MQVMNNSVDKVFEKEESVKGVTICLKMCISTLAGEIANAAQSIQEADLTLPSPDTTKVIFIAHIPFLFYLYILL